MSHTPIGIENDLSDVDEKNLLRALEDLDDDDLVRMMTEGGQNIRGWGKIKNILHKTAGVVHHVSGIVHKALSERANERNVRGWGHVFHAVHHLISDAEDAE